MQLRSPYLLSDARLREAAAGGRPLAEGESAPGIAQLQAALLDLGYGDARFGQAAPDGSFGAGTTALVKSFQHDIGLGQTGVLDAGTLLAADRALLAKLPVLVPHASRASRSTVTPPAQPVRRGAAPIGQSTPRPLPYMDDHYMIGTDDPFVAPDAGAGPWRSKASTFSSRTAARTIRAALYQKAGSVLGWHANEHLRHYFGNTGNDYRIDLENMVRTVPSARRLLIRAYRLAQAFVTDLPPGIYDFVMQAPQSGYNLREESTNWFFAIGGYSSWGKGRAQITGAGLSRQYRMDFCYKFFDRYNWDEGKSVPIGPFIVQDTLLGEFHLEGLAKEFNCYGEIWRRFAWTGARPPEERMVVQQGGR